MVRSKCWVQTRCSYAPAVVQNTLLSTTLGCLFLLLLVNFRCLRLDFASAGEGSVDCPSIFYQRRTERRKGRVLYLFPYCLKVAVVDEVDDEKWAQTVQFKKLEFRILPPRYARDPRAYWLQFDFEIGGIKIKIL